MPYFLDFFQEWCRDLFVTIKVRRCTIGFHNSFTWTLYDFINSKLHIVFLLVGVTLLKFFFFFSCAVGTKSLQFAPSRLKISSFSEGLVDNNDI